MMFDIPLPDDLATAPHDPHPELDGFAPEWPYRSLSLVDPRIYIVRIFRTQPRELAEAAALTLGRRIAEGDYAGLILDYRGGAIAHDEAVFPAVADAFAANFPSSLLIAYLHDDATEPYARLMRSLLRARGLKTARLAEFDAAWTAICSAAGRSPA